MRFLLEVFVGIMYASLAEWLLHKYVLHGKVIPFTKNFFVAHWHSHHKNCNKYDMYDPNYSKSIFNWDASGREIAGIIGLLLFHLPTVILVPTFFYTLVLFALTYVVVHRICHLYPRWGRKYLNWHFWHHSSASGQQVAFNVVIPIWDYILNTRYFGTKNPSYTKINDTHWEW